VADRFLSLPGSLVVSADDDIKSDERSISSILSDALYIIRKSSSVDGHHCAQSLVALDIMEFQVSPIGVNIEEVVGANMETFTA